MEYRLQTLRQKLEDAGCDAFFSFAPPANEYLTGFRGTTSAVIVTHDDAFFLCDFRYTEQAQDQVQGFRIEQVDGSQDAVVAERLGKLGVCRAAFDSRVLTVEQYTRIQDKFSGELSAQPHLLARLRQCKDAGEVERLRQATTLAEDVLDDLIPEIKAGIAERELAARFEYEFKRRGAEGPSFPPIVLFGARSSLPHGMPGGTQLAEGDVVLLDFGCIRNSYCSDLTRTFAFGNIPDSWFEEIYRVTREAQQAALAAVRPGAACKAVDAVARDHIEKAGYGKYFGHGLGHGVGLEIHEGPRLNKHSDAVLEEGMAFTVEPGIYLPGRGGVRIEDLVVVTGDGCEILTRTPKDLKVLGK